MSCDRNYGISIPPCSGHGDCIEDFCYCYPGWTGLADGVLEDGIDCDINIAFIKATAGISMIITFIACVLSMINFDRTKSWVSNRNLIMLSLIGFDGTNLLISIFRLIDPVKYTYNTPQSFTTTFIISFRILFTGLVFFFVIKAVVNSIEAFLRFLPEEKKNLLKSKIDFKLNVGLFCVFLAFASTILEIFMVTFKNRLINLSYGIVLGFFVIIVVLNTFLTGNVIVIELYNYIKTSQSDSTNLEDVKKVEKRLRYGRNIALILLFPFSLLFLFQLWNFLVRKITYVNSIVSINVGIGGIVLNYVFGNYISFSKKYSSSSSVFPEKIIIPTQKTDFSRKNIYEVQDEV